MSHLWAVQVAITALLDADAQLPRFFDVAPKAAERPYGTFGSPNVVRRGLFAKRPQRHSITLDWWGDHQTSDPATGRVTFHANSQVAAYAARAMTLLNGNPLALSTGSMVRLRWESDLYLPEVDRNVRRVQQLFTVDTE